MNKKSIVQAILDKLVAEFESLSQSSAKTRAAGNDPESKAEGKYDTRSTEENYLADELGRLARETAEAAEAVRELSVRDFSANDQIDVGALVQVKFPDADEWFFLGPAGGGIEVEDDGELVTVVTPESPLGSALMGMRTGDKPDFDSAQILAVA